MKSESIFKAYTETVTNYIAHGYVLLTHQYSSSETHCHTEMMCGDNFVRVELVRRYAWSSGDTYTLQVRKIKLPKYAQRQLKNINNWGINTSDKDEIEVIDTWKQWGNSNWYVKTDEELQELKEKRNQRWMLRCPDNDYIRIKDEKKLKVFLKFLRRQKGFKSAKLSDIQYAEKNIYKENGKEVVVYVVRARNKTLVMK